MWRPSSSLLLFSLVLGVANGWARCPKNTACLIFVDDKCGVEGDKEDSGEKGYVWEADTKCDYVDTYKWFYAEIDFEPLSARKWKIVVTARNQEEAREIDPIEFDFGRGNMIKLSNGNEAAFTWTADKSKSQTSLHPLDFVKRITKESINFIAYSFNITADGNNLLDILGGSEVTVKLADGKKLTMKNGKKYVELLNKHMKCELAEIKTHCYNEKCGELSESEPGQAVSCPDKLWLHSTEDRLWRGWQGVDKMRCQKGDWLAEWKEGKHIIDSGVEVQCSAEDPASITPTGWIVLGFCIGGGILLFAAVVVVVVCFMLKRKRRVVNGTTSGRFTASSSKAQTPKRSSKSWSLTGRATKGSSKEVGSVDVTIPAPPPIPGSGSSGSPFSPYENCEGLGPASATGKESAEPTGKQSAEPTGKQSKESAEPTGKHSKEQA